MALVWPVVTVGCGESHEEARDAEASPDARDGYVATADGSPGDAAADVRVDGAAADGGSDAAQRCAPHLPSGCGEGRYCAGSCGWGQCEPRPTSCPEECVEVCGCDGNAYCNECTAARNGVETAHEGSCGTLCSRHHMEDCDEGDICRYFDHACGALRPDGECVEVPVAPCSELEACGCDGTTYGSLCEPGYAGVAILNAGGCREDDCRLTGCPDGSWCTSCESEWRCLEDPQSCSG